MWHIHHIEETDSTNRLALSGSPGDVFTADHQSAGRGRLDHKWLSPPGENLMMSAVVDAAGMEPSDVATFPLVAGLAVADALSRLLDDIWIKWPNDIVIIEKGQVFRKIAGILCERHGDCVIAGIGVNVNQTHFAPEIAERAISLRLLGCETSVTSVRDSILEALNRLAEQWRNAGFASLFPRISRLDALKGRFISVRTTDDDALGVRGVCNGISSDGSLIVGTERIYAGEAHVVLS